MVLRFEQNNEDIDNFITNNQEIIKSVLNKITQIPMQSIDLLSLGDAQAEQETAEETLKTTEEQRMQSTGKKMIWPYMMRNYDYEINLRFQDIFENIEKRKNM